VEIVSNFVETFLPKMYVSKNSGKQFCTTYVGMYAGWLDEFVNKNRPFIAQIYASLLPWKKWTKNLG
jgi:hypothetical protein